MRLVTTFIVLCIAADALLGQPVFFSWARTVSVDANPPPLMPSCGTNAFYTYCPHPGGQHGVPADHTRTLITWGTMETEGHPVAVMMRNRNAPWHQADGPYPNTTPHTPDPDQLARVIHIQNDNARALRYVLGDIEPIQGASWSDVDTFMTNVSEIAFGETDVLDPHDTSPPFDAVPAATIAAWNVQFGNYDCHRYPDAVDLPDSNSSSTWTGRYDPTSAFWNSFANGQKNDRHASFTDTNCNILMPVTYPYYSYVRHSRPDHWSGVQAPDLRGAYVWASVEKIRIATAEFFEPGQADFGKLLLPWITPFVDDNPGEEDVPVNPALPGTYLGSWMPPAEDFLATVQHLRMRGADGFIFWGSPSRLDPSNPASIFALFWSQEDDNGQPLNPWYDPDAEWADPASALNGYDWFEKHAMVAWEAIDGIFVNAPAIYRTETDKGSGRVVSAINDSGQLHILVSNFVANTAVEVSAYFPFAADYTGPNPVDSVALTRYEHALFGSFFTPDINADGVVDEDDLDAYLTLYYASDPRADWNQSAALDSVDLNLFLAAYLAAAS